MISVQGSPTAARLVGLRELSGLPAGIHVPTADHLVRKFLELRRPDVVRLQHWLGLTVNLVAICAELGIPWVVTLHDQ